MCERRTGALEETLHVVRRKRTVAHSHIQKERIQIFGRRAEERIRTPALFHSIRKLGRASGRYRRALVGSSVAHLAKGLAEVFSLELFEEEGRW